jgi:hypothetical protein
MRPDLHGGLAGFTVGLVALTGALALPVGTPAAPEAGLFPLGGALVLLVVSVVLVARGARERMSADGPPIELGPPSAVAASLVAGAMLLDLAGFVPVAALIAVAVMRTTGGTSWPEAGVFSVSLAVGIYLVFRTVLGIHLPAGLLTPIG